MTNHARVAYIFSDAYKGTVQIDGREMTIIEVATLNEMPPIFRRYGVWAITREGVICLTQNYRVTRDRLDEDDGISHMEEKLWVNMRL